MIQKQLLITGEPGIIKQVKSTPLSDIRKPIYTILLKNHGKVGKNKANKIEFYDAYLWIDNVKFKSTVINKYRVRINGKWWTNGGANKFYFLTKSDWLRLVAKSIKF